MLANLDLSLPLHGVASCQIGWTLASAMLHKLYGLSQRWPDLVSPARLYCSPEASFSNVLNGPGFSVYHVIHQIRCATVNAVFTIASVVLERLLAAQNTKAYCAVR